MNRFRSVVWLVIGILLTGTSTGVAMGRHPSLYRELQRTAQTKGWVTLRTEALRGVTRIVIGYFDSKSPSTPYELAEIEVGQAIGSLTLSPDGRQVAFWKTAYPSTSHQYPDRLLVMDVDGSNLHEVLHVFSGGSLSWSPDRQKIAFLGHVSEVEHKESLEQWQWSPMQPVRPVSLYVLDLRTQAVERLVKEDVIELTPQAWSPTSQQIVYVSVDRQVSSYDLSSLTVRHLAKGVDPTYAPTGDRIAYSKLNDDDYYLISSDGSNDELFFRNRRTLQYSPVRSPLLWSPDGRFVLYTRIKGFFSELPTSFIMDTQTKQEERLPQGSYVVASFGGKP